MSETTTEFLRSQGPSYFTGPLFSGAALDQTGQLTFFNRSSALGTTLQAGNATAAITYTLPTAGPASNGYALASTTTGTLSWTDIAGVYAPIGATYVTLSTNAVLTNERVLTGTSNQVTLTDNGAGSTIVLSLPQSIATGSTVQFAKLGLGTTADISSLGVNSIASLLSSNGSGVEIGTSESDGSGRGIGLIAAVFTANSAGHTRTARIDFETAGATANQRGGRIIFYVKSNGATTLNQPMYIDQAVPRVHIGDDTDTTNISVRINGPTTTAANAATLLNSPVAGNPVVWLQINVNGTSRYIPCW